MSPREKPGARLDRRVIVNFSQEDMRRMIKCIDLGDYESVSALVRDAVRKSLRNH